MILVSTVEWLMTLLYIASLNIILKNLKILLGSISYLLPFSYIVIVLLKKKQSPSISISLIKLLFNAPRQVLQN